jgi:hypothetical protein
MGHKGEFDTASDPSYGKSTDVALLGTKLLKAQKPALFH